jgi:glycosyltransferase involved in cell wall biosynthesis
VASDVGGLPEIVDSSVGGLFRAGDPGALASTVVRVLREGDLRAMGRRARERVVDRWSNDRLAERHLEIYQMLLARRRGGG